MEDGNVRNPEYLTGNVENTLLATFLTGTMCANENYKCENTHLATFSTGMLCANVNLKRERFLFYRVLYMWLP